jgi:hypothetical protein
LMLCADKLPQRVRQRNRKNGAECQNDYKENKPNYIPDKATLDRPG